jgi:hypothetical protein
MNDKNTTECTDKGKKSLNIFSPIAVKEFPYPDRKVYFTDSDYDAACVRIDKRRTEYDTFNKFSKAAKTGKRGGGCKGTSVVICGVEHKSLNAAAKHFDICTSTVRERVESELERWTEWRYKNE